MTRASDMDAMGGASSSGAAAEAAAGGRAASACSKRSKGRKDQRHDHSSLWAPCGRCWFGSPALRKWGVSVRRALIGDLPASLSLRTKVRIVLEARPLGHIWMVYQIVLTLLSCAYVAISSTYHRQAKGIFLEEVVFGASVLTDLLLRFYASDHRRWYFFERQALVDVVSIIPVLSDIAHLSITGSVPRPSFQGPIFLSLVQVFKLFRILRVFNVGRQFSSPVVRQTIILVFAIICILYIFSSLINMQEGIPFGSAIYFSVVTVATVGYGDITVASGWGRVAVSLLICISFIWLPYEINSLTQMLSLRSRYLATFTPRADRPNVLLVGHLDAAKLSTFLAEFFHPDRRMGINEAAFYHVVLLDNEDPDDELVEVLEAPLVESRVTFVKGTIMDEEALLRAGANTAVACFVFSDGLAADTEAADAITVLRVLVLKTFRPVLPCYVQLHHAHNRVQLHMLKKQRLVCIEDLKMAIMGLSALYPGFTTLLTNLLKSSIDQIADDRMPMWQQEYVQGTQLEIYMVELPRAFHGLRFDQLAREVYLQLGGRVCLLGVEERELDLADASPGDGSYPLSAAAHAVKHSVKHVLINPGRRYRIVAQPPVTEAWAYVLAGTRQAAESIRSIQIPKQGPEVCPQSPVSLPDEAMRRTKAREMPSASSALKQLHLPEDDEDVEAGGAGENASAIPSGAPASVGMHPSGSRVCFRMPESGLPSSPSSSSSHPPGPDRAPSLASSTSQGGVTVVDDVRTLDHVENHIVVLLPKAADKIQCFLRPLRAQYLQGTPYCKSVVILTEANVGQLQQHCQSLQIPTDTNRAFDPIAASPFDIYVVEGQPHKAGDLRRAGIETAHACVLLADRASVQEIDEEAVDEYAIHQFVTIEKLRARANAGSGGSGSQHARPPLNYVVEVLSVATLKILDQTYKTFKGKAKRHRKHKTVGHFSDLRDRLSVLRSGSPIRAALARGGSPRRPPSRGGPAGAEPLALPVTQTHQQKQAVVASTPVVTPVSGPSGEGGAGLDFGVGHASMYPFVTAGASFLIDVLDIITCQLFYNSDLIRFVDPLLALDHAPPPASPADTVTASGASTLKPGGHWSDLAASRSTVRTAATPTGDGPDGGVGDAVSSGRLGRIPVPLECVGRTYGDLHELLMGGHEAMPLALYRHDAHADVFYVFTGPPPETQLRASDAVFFLAPMHTLRTVLATYGPT